MDIFMGIAIIYMVLWGNMKKVMKILEQNSTAVQPEYGEKQTCEDCLQDRVTW